MDSKMVIKLAIAGVIVGVAYWWLQKNNWYGMLGTNANEFTDPNKLLDFCRANESGTAVFIDDQGRHERNCRDFLAANNGGGGGGTDTPDTSIDAALLAKLIEAAKANPTLGSDSANVDQWNYLLNEIDTAAQTTDLYNQGIRRGENDVMAAHRYLELRAQAGLAALPPQSAMFEHPFAWTM